MLLLHLGLNVARSAESCAGGSNLTSNVPAKRAAESLEKDANAKIAKEDGDLPTEEPPMVALSELQWPPDPLEEGPNALQDPLNRDEPKPLLHSELMAIGMSARNQVKISD